MKLLPAEAPRIDWNRLLEPWRDAFGYTTPGNVPPVRLITTGRERSLFFAIESIEIVPPLPVVTTQPPWRRCLELLRLWYAMAVIDPWQFQDLVVRPLLPPELIPFHDAQDINFILRYTVALTPRHTAYEGWVLEESWEMLDPTRRKSDSPEWTDAWRQLGPIVESMRVPPCQVVIRNAPLDGLPTLGVLSVVRALADAKVTGQGGGGGIKQETSAHRSVMHLAAVDLSLSTMSWRERLETKDSSKRLDATEIPLVTLRVRGCVIRAKSSSMWGLVNGRHETQPHVGCFKRGLDSHSVLIKDVPPLLSSLLDAPDVTQVTVSGLSTNDWDKNLAHDMFWRWVGVVLLSRDRRNRVEDIELLGVSLGESDVAALREVLSVENPLPYLEVARFANHTVTSPGLFAVEVKPNVCLYSGPLDTNDFDEPVKVGAEPEFFRVMSDDFPGEWIAVLVPGVGQRWVRRVAVCKLYPTRASAGSRATTRPHVGVRSFKLLYQTAASNRALVELVPLLGGRLVKLSITGQGTDPLRGDQLLTVLEMACPNLVVVMLAHNFGRFRSGGCESNHEEFDVSLTTSVVHRRSRIIDCKNSFCTWTVPSGSTNGVYYSVISLECSVETTRRSIVPCWRARTWTSGTKLPGVGSSKLLVAFARRRSCRSR